jgi:hypothetical protein
MKSFLSACLLAPVLAFAQAPDASKPVTNLIIELTGDIRTVRPIVRQWWHDETLCVKTAANLTQQGKEVDPPRAFICVRIVGMDV